MLVLAESKVSMVAETSVIFYKQGSSTLAIEGVASSGTDEEKTPVRSSDLPAKGPAENSLIRRLLRSRL